jgi:serine protease Do
VLATGLGLARDQGAVLADIRPGSSADRAGLVIGDVVLALDGKAIENGRQLHVNLYRRTIGEVVNVDVLRSGKQIRVAVPVNERADPLSAAAAVADPRENVVPRLGVLAVTVDPVLAGMLGALRAKAGVLVVSATADAFDAQGESLEPGDVIHAVNSQWIGDLPALKSAVGAVKVGDAIVLQVERNGVLRYVAFMVE